jgi:hypothetical protein
MAQQKKAAKRSSEMADLKEMVRSSLAQNAVLVSALRGGSGFLGGVPALSAYDVFHGAHQAAPASGGTGTFLQPTFARAVKRSAPPAVDAPKVKRARLAVASPAIPAPVPLPVPVQPPVVAAPVVMHVPPLVGLEVPLQAGFQPNGWPPLNDAQVLDPYYQFHGPLLWPDGLALAVLTPELRARLVGHVWLPRVMAGGVVSVEMAAAANMAAEVVFCALYDEVAPLIIGHVLLVDPKDKACALWWLRNICLRHPLVPQVAVPVVVPAAALGGEEPELEDDELTDLDDDDDEGPDDDEAFLNGGEAAGVDPRVALQAARHRGAGLGGEFHALDAYDTMGALAEALTSVVGVKPANKVSAQRLFFFHGGAAGFGVDPATGVKSVPPKAEELKTFLNGME